MHGHGTPGGAATGARTRLVRVREESPGGPPARRSRGAERVLVAGPFHEVRLGLWRLPAGRPPGRDAVPPGARVDEHLAAGHAETSPSWLACADVIVRRVRDPDTAPDALDRLRARFPGALVAVVDAGARGCAVATACGWRAWLVPCGPAVRGPEREPGPAGRLPWPESDIACYASAVHAWVTSGRPLDALARVRLTVVSGRAAAGPVARVLPGRAAAPPAARPAAARARPPWSGRAGA